MTGTESVCSDLEAARLRMIDEYTRIEKAYRHLSVLMVAWLAVIAIGFSGAIVADSIIWGGISSVVYSSKVCP